MSKRMSERLSDFSFGPGLVLKYVVGACTAMEDLCLPACLCGSALAFWGCLVNRKKSAT